MSITLRELVRARLEAAQVSARLPAADDVSAVTASQVTARAPQLDPAVVAAMEAAAQALHQSAVGRELAAEAAEMSPKQVMARARDVAALPEIQHLAALARQPSVFASQALGDGTIIKELMAKYAPRSLLIQFSAMADVGAGISVYVGFALSLDDLNDAVLYIGGGVGIGTSAIVAAGQGVGLTANANSSVTGFCVGADAGGAVAAGALLDVSLGIKAPYWPVVTHAQPSQWTAVVYVLQGIGGSVDVYGGFTLLLIDETLPDIVQPPATHSTTIYSITCDKIQDASGKDELYFTVQVDTEPAKVFRYPLWDYYSIGEGKTWDVGFTINFNSSFTLTLYNSDTGSDEEICSWTTSSIPAAGAYKTLTYDNGSGGVFHNHVHYDVELYTPPRPG